MAKSKLQSPSQTFKTIYSSFKDGGQKDRSIICGNCGWSWKESNAGSQPTKCHKCNTESGQVMMKNGGWLEQYQTKGEVTSPNNFAQFLKSGTISKNNTGKVDNARVAAQPILKNPFIIDPLTGKPAKGDRAELIRANQNASSDRGTIHTPYKKSVREKIIDVANQIDRQGENPVAGIVTEPVKAAMRLMRADKNFDLSSSNSADIVNAIGEGALQTGIDALTVLPIAAEAAPFIKGVGKSAIQKVAGIPSASSLPRLTAEELKIFRQVQNIGRMRATGKPYSQQLQYALDNNLPEEHLQKIFKKSKSEIESAISDQLQDEAFRAANPITDRINLQRPPRVSRQTNTAPSTSLEDVYEMPASLRARVEAVQNNVNASSSRNRQNLDNLFAQLDAGIHSSQRDDIIRNIASDYDINRITNQLNPIPEEIILNTGSNTGRTIINPQSPRLSLLQTARDDWQRYVDNKVPTSEVIHNKFANIVSEYPYYKGPVLENVPSLSLAGSGSLKNVSDKVASQSSFNISSGDVFTGSLNTSHSSYLPQLKQVFKYGEGSPQFLGYKPMNSMGFLSDYNYPSKDIAKYLNAEIDTQIGRGIIPKNIQRPYVKGEHVLLPHYGIKQFEEGGIIEDDMGQWNHPGEITKINSNQITMEGVPYPVMGISDTGDAQMMYPGQDYSFDGSAVTEYPMMQKGGFTQFLNDTKVAAAQSAGNPVSFINNMVSGPIANSVANALLPSNTVEQREDIFRRYRPIEYPNPVNTIRGLVYPNEQGPPLKDNKGNFNIGEEAWRKALDLPVKSNYIIPSKYKPSTAKNPKTQYYTLNKLIDQERIIAEAKKRGWKPGAKYQIESLAPFINYEAYDDHKDFFEVDPLQRFQMSIDPKGEYVSIYDKYDFDFPGVNQIIKPYEFYDRFYDKPKKREGGQMIKRADGSYSKRGLWDNIRANKGSGKKPTKQMLKQERKIKSMRNGGWLDSYDEGGESESFEGPKPIYVTSQNNPRYKSYRDSLNLYNKGEKDFGKYNTLNKQLGVPAKSTRSWNNPIEYDDNYNKVKIQPIEGRGYFFNHNPNVVAGTTIPVDKINDQIFRYKKPQQPVILKKPAVKKPSSVAQPQIQPAQPVQQPVQNTGLAQPFIYGASNTGPGHAFSYGPHGKSVTNQDLMTMDEWNYIKNRYGSMMRQDSNSQVNPGNPTSQYRGFLTENSTGVRKALDEFRNQKEFGGELEMMREGGIPDRYRNKGFTKVGVKRDSTRPGKKWMVLAKKGDNYKVVHGGYDGMKDFTQHGSENRKERFWDRMGGRNSAKAKDPFSPLYWHKRFGTWKEGGQVNWLDNY